MSGAVLVPRPCGLWPEPEERQQLQHFPIAEHDISINLVRYKFASLANAEREEPSVKRKVIRLRNKAFR